MFAHKMLVVESDWLYCSLDQHQRCQLVTDNQLHSFTGALQQTDLHNIAKELHFSSSVLERCRTSEPHSVPLQAFQLLSDWVVNEGGDATVNNFVLRMRNAEIADDIIKSAVLEDCTQ